MRSPAFSPSRISAFVSADSPHLDFNRFKSSLSQGKHCAVLVAGADQGFPRDQESLFGALLMDGQLREHIHFQALPRVINPGAKPQGVGRLIQARVDVVDVPLPALPGR